jgi:hypothetical protein
MEERNDGVFEHLPRRRPSVRTPRRDRLAGEGTPVDAGAGAGWGPAEQPEESRHRLESLALAGIDAAADAVVLGLKVVGRAYEGVRGTVRR